MSEGHIKTKLAIAATILSLLTGIVTYTVTVTLLYAEVRADIKVIKTEIANLNARAAREQQFAEQERTAFRQDLRELRQQLQTRK